MKLTIKGIKYNSVAAACRALGFSHTTMWNRIRRGLPLDTPPDPRRCSQPKKVRIGHRVYPSQMAAAKALGMNYQTLSERIARGIDLRAPLMPGRPKNS